MTSLFDTSSKANDFASKYGKSVSFQKRLLVWGKLVDQYATTGGYCIDVGCGSGAITILSLQKKMHVFAFDPSSQILEIARSYLSGFKNQVHLDILQLPLFEKLQSLKGEADLITCSSVLEYVEDVETSLLELNQLLAHNGYMIVSFPNQDSLIRKIEKYIFKRIFSTVKSYMLFQKHQYSYETAKELFKKSGFEVVDYRYYGLPSKIYKLGIQEDRQIWGTMIVFVLKKSLSTKEA
jgi:2-polyprenyl-3-methyl-5-hydroxy-6-metoxy-1,4-benzoquinol methylase